MIKLSNLGTKRACLSGPSVLSRNIQVEAGKYWEILNDYIPGNICSRLITMNSVKA